MFKVLIFLVSVAFLVACRAQGDDKMIVETHENLFVEEEINIEQENHKETDADEFIDEVIDAEQMAYRESLSESFDRTLTEATDLSFYEGLAYLSLEVDPYQPIQWNSDTIYLTLSNLREEEGVTWRNLSFTLEYFDGNFWYEVRDRYHGSSTGQGFTMFMEGDAPLSFDLARFPYGLVHKGLYRVRLEVYPDLAADETVNDSIFHSLVAEFYVE